MPAFLTHYIFADLLLEKDVSYREVTILGSQGTDPFFYYGYRLIGKRKNIKKIRKFGTEIHHIDLVPFLDYMIKKINTLNGIKKDVLSAYLKGFLMHYVVDRNAHPYVFYRTGFNEKDTSFIHSLFESRLDCLVKKYYKYKVIKPHIPTCINKEYLKIISEAYYEFAQSVMENKYITPLSFYISVKDMTTANKILYSRFGIKKKLIELLAGNTMLNSMSTPTKIKDDDTVDYLNLNHKDWKHPVTGKISNLSFIDILETARKDLDLGLKTISQDEISLLNKYVDNINHDGTKVDSAMIYNDRFYR
ncbi:MAG: zinc dependent phospholipase C family protein [Erysipelotrichaceae bacterium]|jgi:hypothetical protein|nr:zinc dependent phospholipase C family protein [Erysipelotrichaceae bacterium]